MTGGLLSVTKPEAHGSLVKLMFVTQSGTVLGTAEMLNAESWVLQPFRFVSLDEGDEFRLRAAIESSLRKKGD